MEVYYLLSFVHPVYTALVWRIQDLTGGGGGGSIFNVNHTSQLIQTASCISGTSASFLGKEICVYKYCIFRRKYGRFSSFGTLNEGAPVDPPPLWIHHCTVISTVVHGPPWETRSLFFGTFKSISQLTLQVGANKVVSRYRDPQIQVSKKWLLGLSRKVHHYR